VFVLNQSAVLPIPAEKMPKHIAIIMDGNGRWASARGMDRSEGHRAGVKSFMDICTYLDEIGVEYLTVYAFSTENWKRPRQEVDALMKLLESYFHAIVRGEIIESRSIRVRAIGDVSALPDAVRLCIRQTEERTKNNKGLTVNVAINYGGRDEILRAAKQLSENGNLEAGLFTAGQPDPDLLIRTGGEHRISNFMLWQIAYAELVFLDVLWPDFSREDMAEALRTFAGRSRRFGGLTK